MIMMYYWRFWEPCANAMLVVLLPKFWFWIENRDWHNCFWMSLWLFVGWTLTGAKKTSKSTILHNRLNKEKKLLVDVANLATCCYDDYDVLFEVLGTLRKCYVSSPVAKALVLDWKSWLAQLFLDVFLGLTLTGPKKASKSTILHKRLNKEKNSWSMLPIWLLAAMMIMMYYWRFWEPCANAMLVVLLPKLWFWIENHDWHNCFWMSSWGSPLLDPKKLQNQQIHKRLNKEKTPGQSC